jgi:hypothetical protein
MKTFKKFAAQGDLLIQRIDKLPEGVTEMEASGGNFIVGHSETGHHHVVNKHQVMAYQDPNNLLVLFVVVDEDALLEHMRSFDKHETLELKKGIYQINQQREYVAEGFRRAAD